MAGGIKALSRIQLGWETTAGTAVAATTRWRGEGRIEDLRETVFPKEDIGYISGVDRTYVPKLGARITLDDTPATFEQLPYLLAMGVKSVIAGATDTGGSGKIYAYPFPTTAKNTIKTATVEGGDDQEAERMEYAFCESFKLSGKAGAAWLMGGSLLGRQVTLNAFAAATLPAVEEMLFGNSKLYIDLIAGSWGGTVKAQTLLGADIAMPKTGWHPKFTADGALYFSYHEAGVPELTANVTFVHNAVAQAEKVNWRAQTAKLLRILVEGTTLTSAGATYSKKTAILDFAGKWEKFEKLGEQDGNDVVTGLFRARYDPTGAKFANMTVVNQISPLP